MLQDIIEEPLTWFFIAFVSFMTWFCLMAFHYDHKYKVESKHHTVSVLFTDNPYDKGDKVVVTNVEGEYKEFSHNYGLPADTVVITKILR